MLKKSTSSSNAPVFVKPLLFGTLSGALCTLLLLFGAAALCVATDVPAGLVAPMAFVSCAAGAALGGVIAAKIAGKKGWLYGLCAGGVLFLLVSIVGFACVGVTSGAHLAISAALCLACGAVGGIVGVNLKRNNGFAV